MDTIRKMCKNVGRCKKKIKKKTGWKIGKYSGVKRDNVVNFYDKK